jgi:glycosyltransferase involved in cell wall biosynthesis
MTDLLIAIPTKNRSDILPLPLYSLFQQSPAFDVVIYDQSDSSAQDNYIVRQMIDLLQLHKGIDVKHIRSLKDRSLALARVFLLRYARSHNYRYLLMLDDDVMLTPGCLEKLLTRIKANKNIIFAAGVAMDVNNALGHKDYSVDIFHDFKGMSEWEIPHHYFTGNNVKTIRTVTGGFHYLIDMKKVNAEMMERITHKLTHLHGMPCEDIMLEFWLTIGNYNGLLVTDALVYHFPSTAQPRDWYNVTRKLQERISKTGEL